MKKKIVILLLLLFSFSSVTFAAGGIQVIVDGEKQNYDQPPVVKNNRTLVPLRGIFESLGATVTYYSETKEIMAIKGETLIILEIGSNEAFVNDKMVKLDQPAEVINNRTMVPIRFVSESLGADVGWDPNSKTITIISNNTLIDVAAAGDLEAVKEFIEAGEDINQVNSDGATALSLAAQNGYQDVVTYLLENGANYQHKDNKGWNALMYAASEGHNDLITVLVQAGLNVNEASNYGLTPLHIATANGYSETSKYLIELGANIYALDSDGWSTLMYASQSGDLELVQYLVSQNVNINQQDNGEYGGMTPLTLAIDSGNIEIAEFLLLNGADPNIEDTSGLNALIYSAYAGATNLLDMLLQKGMNPDHQTTEGMTALMYAATYGELEAVQLLLDNNANTDLQDFNGWTALISAAFEGETEIVKLLIENGADINMADGNDYTALIYATDRGHIDIVRLLLTSGIDLSAYNQGLLALEVANENKFTDIAELLKTKLNNPEGTYQINTKTSNSEVNVTGTIKYSTTNWVWFIIQKTGEEEEKHVVVPVENGSVITKLYLPFGPGEYTISVYEGKVYDGYYNRATILNVTSTDTRNPLLLPSEDIESESEIIIDLANQITAGLTTDIQKSKAIHDWVVKNIKYDVSTFEKDVWHSALETYELESSDCDGYSRLTAALHRAVGIEAKVVVGYTLVDRAVWGTGTWSTTINHAWNEVLIDGEWIIIDTTWDAGYIDARTYAFVPYYSDDFFNPNPNDFAKTHKKAYDLYE